MSEIDEYLNTVSDLQRAELERIRSIIKEHVPDAIEEINYGIPVFKYKNEYLIGFAGFKNHMSIFPGAEPVEKLRPKLDGFKLSKGTIQFTLDNPLPASILQEALDLCLERITKK